jgi:hypothetical protein
MRTYKIYPMMPRTMLKKSTPRKDMTVRGFTKQKNKKLQIS